MADNVKVWEPASGPSVASDDVSGVQYQRVKLDLGADGATAPVAGSVPVNDNGGALTVDGTVAISGGTITATGPLTDAQLRATPVPVDSRPIELLAATYR